MMTLEAQQEEVARRLQRISSMVGTIDSICEGNNSSLDEVLSALAIYVGMVLRRVPSPQAKQQLMHHFISETRRISKEPSHGD